MQRLKYIAKMQSLRKNLYLCTLKKETQYSGLLW